MYFTNVVVPLGLKGFMSFYSGLWNHKTHNIINYNIIPQLLKPGYWWKKIKLQLEIREVLSPVMT